MSKMGAPTDYTDEMADRICEAIATSSLGTIQLCEMHDWMPSEDTIYKWRYRHAYFAEKYTLAKSRQVELYAEQIIAISDNKTQDYYRDKEGNKRIDPGAVMHRRLQIDTRKWYASKLAPKIYGDYKPQTNDTDNKSLMQQVIDKL